MLRQTSVAMYTCYGPRDVSTFCPRIQEFQFVGCILYIFCVSLSVRVCSTGHVRHCDKQTSRRQEQCFAPARIEPQIQSGGDGGWDGVFDQTRVGGNNSTEQGRGQPPL